MVYALYPRRSSEAEDKQVLSIDAQIDELKKLAKSIGLDLASLDIRQESHSAKAPRSRPVWNGIIKDIEKGKLNGIIAWQANRLSRNAVDTGEMIYLMDTGKLAEVVTPSQVFRNTPNDKMMLNFFCMVAKFENDNKGVDVKRGLNKKAGKGYLPSGAKPGYMNDLHAEKGNKKLFADPVRFPIIKEAWRLMLTGLHTPPQILRIINGQHGYRTTKRKKIGGHPMMRSQIYKMFRDQFYYGRFEYPEGSGQWYDGQYEKMITEAEYWKVQELLGRKGMPRPQIHSFTFSGMMQCGFCGAFVTAEFKTKKQKNGSVHHYIYYHCTHRKLNTKCTQGVVEENKLILQICDKLDEVEVPEELHAFALKWTESENKKEAGNDEDLLANLTKELATCEATIDGLIDMRARHEIGEDDFKRRHENAQKEKARVKNLIEDLAQADDASLAEATSDAYRFVAYAKKKLKEGTPEARRAIFGALGSNRTLIDKKLNVDVEETLLPMKKVSLAVRAIHEQVRTAELPINERTLEEFYLKSPVLLRDQDSNLEPYP
jgi:site-specific DNA recombinase